MGPQAASNARAVRLAAAILGAVILMGTSVANPGDAYGASRLGGLSAASMALSAPMLRMLDGMLGAQAVDDGSDNRLTILAVGLDSRGTGFGRTDSIQILSIKGNSISMASIPRDTARVPNPAGGTFSGKINGIVRQYLNAGNSAQTAMNKFEIVVEDLLGITIDYNAAIWFGGLTTLVGRVDPIFVNSPEIRDSKLIDDHAQGQRQGVYFPNRSSYALYDYNQSGRPLCNGNWRFDNPPIDSVNWCHRALPFTRSRKGPGNNDWVRSSRQQSFIYAAINAVSSGELSSLASTAQNEGGGRWMTNMPISLSNAQDLYNRLHNANLGHRVVFKPNTYAKRIAGTSGYELKLTAVRSWCNAYMS